MHFTLDLPPFACRKLNYHLEDVKDTGVKLASQLGMDRNSVSQIDQLYRMIYVDQEPYFAYVEPFTVSTRQLKVLEYFIDLRVCFFVRLLFYLFITINY